MTSRLDSEIRRLVEEIVDIAPEEIVPPKNLRDTRIPTSGQSQSRTLYRFALAAVIAAVVGGAGVLVANRIGESTTEAANATPAMGLTYRYQVKTTVMQSDTWYEDPAEQARADAKAEPSEGPRVEGEVNLVDDRSELSLTMQPDSFLDNLLEPSESDLVRLQGETMIFEFGDRFYEVNPFVAGGKGGKDGISPLMAEATKTLDRLDVLLEEPEWVEVGTQTINGAATTHLQAELSVSRGGERFATDSVLGLISIDGEWEGEADVWLGDDGFARRVIVEVNDEGRAETLQVDYLDYDAEIDIEWPSIYPVTSEMQPMFD